MREVKWPLCATPYYSKNPGISSVLGLVTLAPDFISCTTLKPNGRYQIQRSKYDKIHKKSPQEPAWCWYVFIKNSAAPISVAVMPVRQMTPGIQSHLERRPPATISLAAIEKTPVMHDNSASTIQDDDAGAWHRLKVQDDSSVVQVSAASAFQDDGARLIKLRPMMSTRMIR